MLAISIYDEVYDLLHRKQRKKESSPTLHKNTTPNAINQRRLSPNY